jgi:hypothetical protein
MFDTVATGIVRGLGVTLPLPRNSPRRDRAAFTAFELEPLQRVLK